MRTVIFIFPTVYSLFGFTKIIFSIFIFIFVKNSEEGVRPPYFKYGVWPPLFFISQNSTINQEAQTTNTKVTNASNHILYALWDTLKIVEEPTATNNNVGGLIGKNKGNIWIKASIYIEGNVKFL